ncbi:hypothetical protein TrCOL_g8568 [Triparma columacea]|uniref:Uncharacterized protein n=1 Tax=Triparma columacea TaxID=722753 RepID=A0A9W7G9S9_9STRA|nr:hypothetical protein TrCOL_g8568 [Triparma columacea]
MRRFDFPHAAAAYAILIVSENHALPVYSILTSASHEHLEPSCSELGEEGVYSEDVSLVVSEVKRRHNPPAQTGVLTRFIDWDSHGILVGLIIVN